MTNNKPNTTAVEVNGIRFEILLKNSVIPLPPKEENAITETEFEVIVTNNTPNTFYFDFGNNLIPKLITPDGQIFFHSGSSDWVSGPRESEFLLCKPGETVIFLDSTVIIYVENEFVLRLDSQRGTFWSYRLVGVGSYQLEFIYINSEAVVKARANQVRKDKTIENIWTGKVALPVLEFQLVDESI